MGKSIIICLLIFSIFVGMYREDEHKNHFILEANKKEIISNADDFLRETIYNYISCLDQGLNIIDDSIPVIGGLNAFTYERVYNKVMKNREFINHTVEDGETLDEILKKYNDDINDIDDFRRVVKEKNKEKISDTYNIESGDQLLIPSEK